MVLPAGDVGEREPVHLVGGLGEADALARLGVGEERRVQRLEPRDLIGCPLRQGRERPLDVGELGRGDHPLRGERVAVEAGIAAPAPSFSVDGEGHDAALVLVDGGVDGRWDVRHRRGW
jgi:hypothetical protein